LGEKLVVFFHLLFLEGEERRLRALARVSSFSLTTRPRGMDAFLDVILSFRRVYTLAVAVFVFVFFAVLVCFM